MRALQRCIINTKPRQMCVCVCVGGGGGGGSEGVICKIETGEADTTQMCHVECGESKSPRRIKNTSCLKE